MYLHTATHHLRCCETRHAAHRQCSRYSPARRLLGYGVPRDSVSRWVGRADGRFGPKTKDVAAAPPQRLLCELNKRASNRRTDTPRHKEQPPTLEGGGSGMLIRSFVRSPNHLVPWAPLFLCSFVSVLPPTYVTQSVRRLPVPPIIQQLLLLLLVYREPDSSTRGWTRNKTCSTHTFVFAPVTRWLLSISYRTHLSTPPLRCQFPGQWAEVAPTTERIVSRKVTARRVLKL